MKSLNKIWNTIKDFNLIKYEITNGTIESQKFELLLKFDGIIQKGNTMTINDLAKIVNNLSNTVNGLAIEMREGFKRVDEKFSDMKQYIDTRFAEVDAKFDDMKQYIDTRFAEVDAKFDDMKQYMDNRFDKIEQRLDDHDAIFKRNNLE